MQDAVTTFDAFNDPQARHAMLVHMPIALSILGVPVVLAAAMFKKHVPLRVVGIVLYVMLAVTCMLAVDSGEAAQDDIPGAMTPEASEMVDGHARIGRTTYFGAFGVAGLMVVSAFVPAAFGVGTSWLAVIVALGTGGLVGVTGHRGGLSVYQFGVGTPDFEFIGPPVVIENDGDVASSAASTTTDAVFATMVYPILETHCLRCHGTSWAPKGGLSLVTVERMMQGGSSGPSIVPGDPDASLLVQRITTENLDDLMPPTGERLPDDDIAIIRRWIRDGTFTDVE